MTKLADQIADHVETAVAEVLGGLETAAGTVVTSPSQISTDPLTVQLDGSALAVPVKQIRAFPVFPGMRVALIRIGTDWVVIGSFTQPGAGTGTMRMAVGADTTAELRIFGVEVAFLFYVTDKISGVELGYFFIGISNKLDGSGNEKVCLFGHVKYPTAGDPLSPTQSDVKTHFQMNLDGYTIFKDHSIYMFPGVGEISTASTDVHLGTGGDLIMDDVGNLLSGNQGRGLVNYAFFNASSAAVSAETDICQMTGCTIVAGRAYKIVPFGGYYGVAGGLCLVQVRKTNLAGPVWGNYLRVRTEGSSPVMNGNVATDGHGIIRRDPALSNLTNVTLVQTIQNSLGAAGNVQAYADASGLLPRGLKLYDIGRYEDYPEAFPAT